MRENDFNYIKEVTEFFNSTRSEDNPKGNISAVTEKFSISRTKATKILITSGAIDTPLHRQVMGKLISVLFIFYFPYSIIFLTFPTFPI